MLTKIFEYLKNVCTSDELLGQNVNGYYLLDVPDDPSFPYMLMQRFNSFYVQNAKNDNRIFEIKFDLVFGFNYYDEFFVSEFSEKITELFGHKTHVDHDVELIISIDKQSVVKNDELWRIVFNFSGFVFIKTELSKPIDF
jgi:hypothetical protein